MELLTQQIHRGRKKSFLDSSPKIDGIIDILTIVAEQPAYANQIYRKSRIRMKNSVIKYTRYCVDKGFIVPYRTPIRGNHVSKFEKAKRMNCYYVFYKITVKGRTFLGMVL